MPGVFEQLKCKAKSLRQDMLVLVKEVERLEEAAEGEGAQKGIPSPSIGDREHTQLLPPCGPG